MYILVVDDERHALEATAAEVKKVFPAAHIREEGKASSAISWANELAQEGTALSFAFLDIQLRGTNGIEIARQLKLIHPNVKLLFCTSYSEYAFDAFNLCAKGYLLKPIHAQEIERVLDEMVTGWRKASSRKSTSVRIQTFGHFAVFVDEKPLSFDREKAKELLAYLVDRHGAPVTTEQIAMVLWENEPYDRNMKNRTTTIISSLRNTLRAAGLEEILVKTWNQIALNTEKIQCDAYDFEKGDIIAVNAFRGEYMVNYSWAEFTAGRYTEMDSRMNR